MEWRHKVDQGEHIGQPSIPPEKISGLLDIAVSLKIPSLQEYCETLSSQSSQGILLLLLSLHLSISFLSPSPSSNSHSLLVSTPTSGFREDPQGLLRDTDLIFILPSFSPLPPSPLSQLFTLGKQHREYSWEEICRYFKSFHLPPLSCYFFFFCFLLFFLFLFILIAIQAFYTH